MNCPLCNNQLYLIFSGYRCTNAGCSVHDIYFCKETNKIKNLYCECYDDKQDVYIKIDFNIRHDDLAILSLAINKGLSKLKYYQFNINSFHIDETKQFIENTMQLILRIFKNESLE